jgi:hypothetical protein
MRAYNSRKRNGMVAPIVTVDGRELHERETFKLWLKENATALGWESNDPRLLAMLKKLEGKTMRVEKTLSAAVIAALSLFGSLPANAQLAGGVSVPTSTPVVVIQPATSPRTFERVVNAGASTAGTAWCTHNVSPGAITSLSFLSAFAPHAAGAFPIGPYGNSNGYPSVEEFDTKNVPQGALICVSDGGTSGSSPAALTVDTQQ